MQQISASYCAPTKIAQRPDLGRAGLNILQVARHAPFVVRCDATGELLPVVRPGHTLEDLATLAPELLKLGVHL